MQLSPIGLPVSELDTPALLIDLGIAYEGAHQPDKAQACFQKVFDSSDCPPEAYLKLGQDGDGDGRVDLWGDPADALASAAIPLRSVCRVFSWALFSSKASWMRCSHTVRRWRLWAAFSLVRAWAKAASTSAWPVSSAAMD